MLHLEAMKNNSTRFLTLLLFISPVLIASCTSRQRQLEKTVVLEVSGEKLSAKAFAESLAQQLRQYDALTVKDSSILLRTKEEILKEFVVSVITKTWAKQNKVEVTEQDLDKEVNAIRGNYPDDQAFRQALASENIPFQQWRENLRSSLLQRRVVRKLMEDMPEPTDEEAKKYFEENGSEFNEPERIRLTQVVVANESDAEQIHEKAKKGANLGELAKKYSIAPEATQSGDTGWIPKGTLQVFDRAFALPVGGLSPILKSSYGLHIYKVVEKQPARRMSFEQAKTSIKNRLQAEREQSIYASWLEGQLQKTKVLRNENIINSISVETKNF